MMMSEGQKNFCRTFGKILARQQNSEELLKQYSKIFSLKELALVYQAYRKEL